MTCLALALYEFETPGPRFPPARPVSKELWRSQLSPTTLHFPFHHAWPYRGLMQTASFSQSVSQTKKLKTDKVKLTTETNTTPTNAHVGAM